MKTIYNKIFFVLALLFYGQAIEAYVYRIYNNTDVNIKVLCYYVGPSQSAIIDKGKDHLFSFPGDKCMSVFDLSAVDGSYVQDRIIGVCKNQDYDVRIKKDKNGNPATKTYRINKHGIRMEEDINDDPETENTVEKAITENTVEKAIKDYNMKIKKEMLTKKLFDVVKINK